MEPGSVRIASSSSAGMGPIHSARPTGSRRGSDGAAGAPGDRDVSSGRDASSGVAEASDVGTPAEWSIWSRERIGGHEDGRPEAGTEGGRAHQLCFLGLPYSRDDGAHDRADRSGHPQGRAPADGTPTRGEVLGLYGGA